MEKVERLDVCGTQNGTEQARTQVCRFGHDDTLSVAAHSRETVRTSLGSEPETFESGHELVSGEVRKRKHVTQLSKDGATAATAPYVSPSAHR